MRLALALFLGLRPPRAEFEGSPSEFRTYETACRIWRSAGFYVRQNKTTSPTLGATVSRGRLRLAGRVA